MYVVTGVTGKVGGVVAHELQERRAKLRVVVRTKEQATDWRARGAQVQVCKLESGGVMSSVLRGSNGAFLIIPPNPAAPDVFAWQKQVADALAQATAASTLEMMVFLSSIGAQHESGTGPIAGLHYAEGKLRTAGREVHLLRAPFFIDNWTGAVRAARESGVLRSFLREDQPVEMAPAREVGRKAAEILITPAGRSRTFELHAPAYRPADVAAALSRILGKPITLETIPPEAHEQTFVAIGVPAPMAASYAEMYRGISEGRVAWEGTGCETLRTTVSLETALAEILAAG